MLSNAEIVEKRVEEVNSFVSRLVGSGYEQEMIKRFPKADFKFFPAEKLPYVGEGKVWVCDCGCGEKDPVLIPYIVAQFTSAEGLEAARVEGIWVSPCTAPGFDPEDGVRHFGMELWDNEIDDLADPYVRLEGNC